jgi:hypothetical protein
MENLPEHITKRKTPLKIDLILGGGAFNGSYILGALYFIKELEKKNYIIVKRMSTCSISTILGLLYFTDNLDRVNELYLELVDDLKNKGNLSKLYEIKNLLKQNIPNDIGSFINDKLYICYNNVNVCKKRVVNKYKDIDKLFDIITRSCFIPFMIDYKPTYKNKYIDGIIPYFFKSKNKKNRKIFYLDVYTLDKIIYTINIKNEKNNYHRLLEGMLDINKFFIKNCNTTMCSDLDKWSLYNYGIYYIYIIIQYISLRIINIINRIQNIINIINPNNIKCINIEVIIKYLVNSILLCNC